jgi:hypothetical protein
MMLAGCASKKSLAPNNAKPPTEKDEIILAVAREMIAHWSGRELPFPKRFFFSIDEKDASSEWLATFRDEGIEVEVGSKYEHDHGIHCSIERVRQFSATEASAYGGYLFGPLGGEWGPYTLQKTNRIWIVTKWKPELFAHN